MVRHCVIVLAACGSSPSRPVVTAPPPAPVVTVDVGAEIVKLGEAWRTNPADTAPLGKLIDLARSTGQWRPAVPYLAASFETTELAVDAAFDATIALNDPEATTVLLTPLSPRDWSRSKIIKPATVGAAETRVGRAMIPAYLGASKLVDHVDVRGRAIEYLARWGIREARPLFLELLKAAPFLERTSGGSMEDPRGFFHFYAIRGLEALGPDPEAADALVAFAFDDRNWEGDRRDVFRDALPIVDTSPAQATMVRLLACAIDPKHFTLANECGGTYGLFAESAAQLEPLLAAPPSDEPFYSDYKTAIVAWRRELACNHDPGCLVPLVETLSDRQSESAVIEKAVRDLTRHADPSLRPTLLALVDELEDYQKIEELAKWFPRIEPGPCGDCIAHLEAALARHERDRDWAYVETTKRAIEAFRARQPAGATIPAMQSIRTAFAAIPAAEHTALRTHQWDRSLFADDVFGIGRDATEVGSGAETVLGFVTKDFADTSDGIVRSSRGVRGHVMWDAELEITKEHGFAQLSQLVVEDHGVYKVRAWSASSIVSDYEVTGKTKRKVLPVPAPIADVHGDAELEAAARAAFGSRKAYLEALSEQEDAFTFGNDLDREWRGPMVKAGFEKMPAFKLRDGVHVEKVSDDVGFAAANLDVKTGAPRTYRVLAVFAKTAGAWKIVQAHWSFAALR